MIPHDTHSIDDLFTITRPRNTHRILWYVLIGFAGAFLFAPILPVGNKIQSQRLALILPWLVVICLFGTGWLSSRRQRQRRRTISLAWQHLLLEEWTEARTVLKKAMQHPIQSPSDRCRAFMILAILAEQGDLYETAQQIYETLLIERIGDGYQLQEAQLALTSVKLQNQELTDAVHLLDRLERVPMPLALRAVYDLIRLSQQVFMGHHGDAVENISARRNLYKRYLSTRAGYGYGLMAGAMYHLQRHEEASQLWLDATTLIPASKLVKKYAFLTPVSDTYPAMEPCL